MTPAWRASGQPPSELESGAYIIGGQLAELSDTRRIFFDITSEENSMKLALIIATAAALATPALAEEVGGGGGVGPVGAGATVGQQRDYDRDRDRDRDRTTVIKEREPTDRTTVIKKENEDGTRSKTVIHDQD